MILNLTKNTPISRCPVYADSFINRTRGMIGRDFTDFDAMVFERCNIIHTMFMAIPIDVLFIDGENRICDIRQHLKPWIPFVRCGKAMAVIEMPAGNVERTGTMKGDVVDLNAELTTAEKEKRISKDILGAAEAVVPFKADCDKL